MTELSPLRERVEAPHRLELPIHPLIAMWRPLEPDDAPALARLHRAADAVDHPEHAISETELRTRLSRSSLQLARDTIAGLTDAGTIVAYGINLIDQHPETVVRVLLDGAIHPEVRGRGLGRQLLQWQRGRAQQQLAASDLGLPGWIISWQSASNSNGVALAQLLGFRPARYVVTLARDLAGEVAPYEPRGEVRVVPWTPALASAALDAHRDAFQDHWGLQPTSAEAWHDLTAGPFLRPELSFLAVDAADTSRVVGYVITSVYEHDFARQGFTSARVNLIGTRRASRDAGIASALLSQVLAAAQRASLQKAVLEVDSENPKGRLGLYESQGFRPTGQRSVALVLNY